MEINYLYFVLCFITQNQQIYGKFDNHAYRCIINLTHVWPIGFICCFRRAIWYEKLCYSGTKRKGVVVIICVVQYPCNISYWCHIHIP